MIYQMIWHPLSLLPQAEFVTKCKHVRERMESRESEQSGVWLTEEAMRKSGKWSPSSIKNITSYCKKFPENLCRLSFTCHAGLAHSLVTVTSLGSPLYMNHTCISLSLSIYIYIFIYIHIYIYTHVIGGQRYMNISGHTYYTPCHTGSGATTKMSWSSTWSTMIEPRWSRPRWPKKLKKPSWGKLVGNKFTHVGLDIYIYIYKRECVSIVGNNIPEFVHCPYISTLLLLLLLIHAWSQVPLKFNG